MSISSRPRFFGKADIFDAFGLGRVQIAFGCKATVQGNFQRVASVSRFLAIQHLFNQCAICGIALKNDTIEDKVRGSTGQANLMAIMVIPAVFDDDVRVFLENREYLLVGRYAFALNNPAIGLVVDLTGQIAVMFDAVQ